MELKIENLSKRYANANVLEHINYTFSSGKIYGLIGRNGAGKTTFFNCLNHSISKNAGKITLTRGDISCALRQEDIGFVESTPILPEFLTGAEFIQFLKKIQNCTQSLESLFALVDLKEEDQNKLIKDKGTVLLSFFIITVFGIRIKMTHDIPCKVFLLGLLF